MNTHTNNLLLITCSHLSAQARSAYQIAYDYLQMPNQQVDVFFYSDGAYIANRYIWHNVDTSNLQTEWQLLAKKHNFALNVCVSTALSRGITDIENSKRHNILQNSLTDDITYANNLADGFELVGLGVLAEMMHQADNVTIF